MKKFPGFIFFLLLTLITLAQDSAQYNGKAGIEDVRQGDPGLFMLMMMMLMTIVIALILTIFLAMVFWVIMLGLAFAGIVSFSVFMGLYQRSVRAGFFWFVMLCFGFVGMAGGALIYSMIVGFTELTFSWTNVFIYAVPAGLIAGVLAGWLVLKLMKKMLVFVKGKISA